MRASHHTSKHKRKDSPHERTQVQMRAGQCTQAHQSMTREAPEQKAHEGKYEGTDEDMDESRGKGNEGGWIGTVSRARMLPLLTNDVWIQPAMRALIQFTPSYPVPHLCPTLPAAMLAHALPPSWCLSHRTMNKSNGWFAGHVRVVIVVVVVVVVVVEQVRGVLIPTAPYSLCPSPPLPRMYFYYSIILFYLKIIAKICCGKYILFELVPFTGTRVTRLAYPDTDLLVTTAYSDP